MGQFGHHLLTLMSFQTCMTYFLLNLMWKKRLNIWLC